jgi:dTDP-4-dehydrorhamnose reductase
VVGSGKILVTGAQGGLGAAVCAELQRRGVEHKGVGRSELDLTVPTAPQQVLSAYRPQAVIHCAAYTAVDKAETEPLLCLSVNARGTKTLAQACWENGARLLYVSSDYVFAGTGSELYKPDDTPAPLSVYGMSKLLGEDFVRAIVPQSFVVRTSWVYGAVGGSFVKTMLRLGQSQEEVGVVCDQIGSPTYTDDLAALLCEMVGTERYGVYHATGEGFCSWAELAAEVFRLSDSHTRVKPLTTEAYGARAVRPLNSRLDKSALSVAGFARLPDWHVALEVFLAKMRGKAI